MTFTLKPILAAIAALSITFTIAPAANAAPITEPTTTGVVLLEALEVEDPATATYSRSAFKHWIDEDGDRFDTRAEVLIAESLAPTKTASKTSKTIITGQWFSPYDNLTLTSASKVDIDHYVALAEAWKSGANTWTATERMQYANDLGYDASLIAVSASQNRSKSDKDPAAWMPKNTGYHCQYVTTWVAVKYRWSLSVDPAEKTAIAKTLSTCAVEAITIPTPPIAKAPTPATADGAVKGTQMIADFITKWTASGAVIQYVDISQKFIAGVDANKDGKFTGKEVKAVIRVESHRYNVLIAGAPAVADDAAVTADDKYTLTVK